jgi:two-component system, NarL family, response regulator NreC
MTTTIVLADDHRVVREGLRALLEAEPGFRVVGQAGDGLEAVELVARLQPRVLVVDLMMPSLNGLEVVRQVASRAPGTRVIVLSMHANEAYVLDALRHGVAGYVLKDASGAELVRAVREVMAGRRYLSAPLSLRAIDAYAERARALPGDAYEALTSRERQVFQLAAEGHTSAEIAERLGISPRTAETHRANLMRKLGLRSQGDLVHFALQRGLLPLEGRPPRRLPGEGEEED